MPTDHCIEDVDDDDDDGDIILTETSQIAASVTDV